VESILIACRGIETYLAIVRGPGTGSSIGKKRYEMALSSTASSLDSIADHQLDASKCIDNDLFPEQLAAKPN
jgi:hypothetical protein